MKLIVIGSNSSGNAYALDAGGEILLLEAGCKLAYVNKAIGFRVNNVVGCLVSHSHGDHSKYAEFHAKAGIHIYCNQDVADKKKFPFGAATVLRVSSTKTIGSFRVAPIELHHDVPNFGYLIQHPDMGTLLFVTDTYKIPVSIRGINHFLIEANYSDDILKQNVWNGKINKQQADRIMLSHMSLQYTVKYLVESEGINASTVTLCHLSERNSDPVMFRNVVQGAIGVPCNIAVKGLTVELNKQVI
jgi:metal-dependent hydrolase (beta-lactamase superfamily II)